MPHYIVWVEETSLERYSIEADTFEDAKKAFTNGDSLGDERTMHEKTIEIVGNDILSIEDNEGVEHKL